MKNVWYLTFATFTYALGNGLMIVSLPQAALSYNMSSDEIGLLSAGGAAGYMLGCIVLGQVLHAYCGKRVALIGVYLGALSILVIAQCSSIWPAVIGQLVYGIAQGAFWPFLSAWLLEMQTPEISKTRLLRFYNAGWTSGAACGMYLGGLLCEKSWTIAAIYLGSAITLLSCVGPLLTPGPKSHLAQDAGPEPAALPADPIGFPILLAGIIANVTALGTRAMISFNYPELNKLMGFDARRMGLFGAVALGGQLAAFLLGAVYEKYLGSRRLYVAMSGMLIVTTLCFAYKDNLGLLVASILLCGIITAMGFQAALIAATEWFTSRRTGTTIHEGLVGFAQVLPWLAGLATQYAKNHGTDARTALTMPFVILPMVLAVLLVVQIMLVSCCRTRRLLLPHHETAGTANSSAVTQALPVRPLPLADRA
jgi:MFS family permease